MTAQPFHPILIVEDDEPTQNLLRTLLRTWGYPSDTAANGREAIELLRAKTYSAIILDVMMPEVGGHDVVSFVTASANPTPIIVCSAAGHAALAGMDVPPVKVIIRKPFDIHEVLAAVRATASES